MIARKKFFMSAVTQFKKYRNGNGDVDINLDVRRV